MKKEDFIKAQRNEITEHYIYSKLANKVKDKHNKKILKHIAKDELKHYNLFKKITKRDVSKKKFQYYFYIILATFFGITFALRLMEKGEGLAIKNYQRFPKELSKELIHDEHTHEQELLDLLSEKKIEYAGSIVLGLNDALVELTGALAGLTFALRNSKIIAITGVIIGFAAALSMAASEYLSSKEDTHEKSRKSPLRGALYTGTAYLITVVLLILPYLLLSNVFTALAVMLCITVAIIGLYTFYISTAKNLKFWKRFLEMALISLGVAVISFGVGMLLRVYVGVEV